MARVGRSEYSNLRHGIPPKREVDLRVDIAAPRKTNSAAAETFDEHDSIAAPYAGTGIADEVPEISLDDPEVANASQIDVEPQGAAVPTPSQCRLFRGPVGDMVDHVAAAQEVWREFPTAFAAAVIGSAAQGKYVVDCGLGWREQLVTYSLVVAPSGYGKTGSVEPMTAPIKAHQSTLQGRAAEQAKRVNLVRDLEMARIAALKKEHNTKGKSESDRVQLYTAIKAAEDKLPHPVVTPTLIAGDITPERTATLMAANNGRLALLSAEAGATLGNIAGQYSKTGTANFEIFLCGYDGEYFARHRMDETTECVMHRPTLNIGWCVQPAVMAAAVSNPALRDRGLLARFMFLLLPQRTQAQNYDKEIPVPVANAYAARVRSLLELPARQSPDGDIEPTALRLTDEAQAWLRQWRREWVDPRRLQNGDMSEGVLASWCSKLAGMVARLSGIVHLAERHADDDTTITLATLERVISYAEAVLVPHAMFAFGADGDTAVDHVWASIVRRVRAGKLRADQQMMVRNVQQPLRKTYPNLQTMHPVLEQLAALGRIEYVARSHLTIHSAAVNLTP